MIKNVAFLLVVFVTNILQAITGFAGTMLAMPASILLIGLTPAKAVLNVLGLLASAWIAVRCWRDVCWREVLKISCFMSVGIIVGAIMGVGLPLQFLLKGYAVLIILIAIKKMFLPGTRILPEWMMKVILLSAGVIHGLFISGGSFLVVYASARFQDKSEFRATLSAVWVILNTGLMVTHIGAGYFDQSSIILTLMAVPAVAAGVIVGTWIHQRMKQEYFLKMTYVLLILSGLLILR